MARDGVQRAGIRWMIIAAATIAVFGPSFIVITQEGLLRAEARTTPLVSDQSAEDRATDGAAVGGTGPDEPDLPASKISPSSGATGLPQDVLWEANPGLGTGVFEGLELGPGTITVADDPQKRFGPSFRYETWDNADGQKERCESRGLRRPDGSVVSLGSAQEGRTFYIGWRSLFDPMPTAPGRWITLFELHVSGVDVGGLNIGPVVLRTLGDGRLYLQQISPNGTDRHIWSAAMPLNNWSSFVVGFRLSRNSSDGWVEFWYNGVQQRFGNGQTRYPGATLWGTHVNPKFGVYRSGGNSGHAVAYVNRARLGTTFASVAL